MLTAAQKINVILYVKETKSQMLPVKLGQGIIHQCLKIMKRVQEN